jgi:hypothetical protein
MMDRLRGKVAANMAQKGMEPDMADRAGRALFRRGADRVRPDMMMAPEGRTMGMKKGGEPMKESKAMMKKEVSFMKKKGAPKSMIRHEEAEYGMKKGVKKMAGGGMTGSYRKAADGIASKGKTKGKMVKMNKGGYC